jgi:acyl-coenzyme A synthetase/AMP-(fatty) acid ligase
MIFIKKIIEAANKNPAQVAFIFQDKYMTYGQFLSFFALVTKRLADAGIKEGDCVGVSMDQSPLHVATILGISRLGAISVPIVLPSSELQFQAMVKKFNIKKLVCLEHIKNIPMLETIHLTGLSYNEDEYNFNFLQYEPEDNLPARIYLTSGSTGIPSGIVYTQAYWHERVIQTVDDIEQSSRVIPPDLHLTLGSIFAFGAMLAGATVIFPKDNSYQNFILALNLHAATHIILPPFAISGLFNFTPQKGIAFPTLKHMRIVGSTPPPNMIKQIIERMSPNVYVPYGMTEIGAISIADRNALELNEKTSGQIKIDTLVEVVDGKNQILSKGKVGEIRVKKKNMPSYYFNEPEKTKIKFREGYFYTGDLGYIDNTGHLIIEGRIDDMINLDGEKIHPLPLEQALLTSPNIQDVGLFPVKNKNHETVLAAAFVSKNESALEALKANPLIERLVNNKFILLDQLPRNESGKLLRKELSEQFLRVTSLN